MTLSRGSPLHAVVSTADARAHASYMSETMEERDRDQFDRLCSSIDVRDAQISEADDRGHVLEQVASLLDGGLAAINTAVLQALSTWMRSEAFVALKRLPALERGFSPVCVNLANHLEVNVDWAPSAEVLSHHKVELSLTFRDLLWFFADHPRPSTGALALHGLRPRARRAQRVRGHLRVGAGPLECAQQPGGGAPALARNHGGRDGLRGRRDAARLEVRALRRDASRAMPGEAG